MHQHFCLTAVLHGRWKKQSDKRFPCQPSDDHLEGVARQLGDVGELLEDAERHFFRVEAVYFLKKKIKL